jgi:hypothetical protein
LVDGNREPQNNHVIGDGDILRRPLKASGMSGLQGGRGTAGGKPVGKNVGTPENLLLASLFIPPLDATPRADGGEATAALLTRAWNHTRHDAAAWASLCAEAWDSALQPLITFAMDKVCNGSTIGGVPGVVQLIRASVGTPSDIQEASVHPGSMLMPTAGDGCRLIVRACDVSRMPSSNPGEESVVLSLPVSDVTRVEDTFAGEDVRDLRLTWAQCHDKRTLKILAAAGFFGPDAQKRSISTLTIEVSNSDRDPVSIIRHAVRCGGIDSVRAPDFQALAARLELMHPGVPGGLDLPAAASILRIRLSWHCANVRRRLRTSSPAKVSSTRVASETGRERTTLSSPGLEEGILLTSQARTMRRQPSPAVGMSMDPGWTLDSWISEGVPTLARISCTTPGTPPMVLPLYTLSIANVMSGCSAESQASVQRLAQAVASCLV